MNKINKKTHTKFEVLCFIWKWKVVSTNIMFRYFYSHCSVKTACGHLLRLKNEGFIQYVYLQNANKKIWSLTKLGFNFIKDLIDELQEEGFASEHPEHDYWVTAFQMGDWLLNKPTGAKFYTEQELRRYHTDIHPYWVPKNEYNTHRADGYWLLPTNDRPIVAALEVELNRKTHQRIKSVARFYGDEELVSRVIWVIPKSRKIKALQKVIDESGADHLKIHNFVYLEEFQKKSWGAHFIHGPEKGLTMRSFMQNPKQEKRKNSLSICYNMNYNDLRLFPAKSIVSNSLKEN